MGTGAPSRSATDRCPGPTPIIENTGPKAEPPASPTGHCSAPPTTPSATKAAGPCSVSATGATCSDTATAKPSDPTPTHPATTSHHHNEDTDPKTSRRSINGD